MAKVSVSDTLMVRQAHHEQYLKIAKQIKFEVIKMEKINKDELKAVGEKLRLAAKSPPSIDVKPNISKAESIRFLLKDIKLLQDRGYSVGQIVEMLNGNGLVIAKNTLQVYMSRAKRNKEVKEAKQVPPSKGTFEPSPDRKDI